MELEFEVKFSWARVALMVTYLFGIGVFLYTGEWADALMLLAIVYWTNVAWFHEGKGRRLFILLHEAKEIMERAIKERKEPVSKKGEEA